MSVPDRKIVPLAAQITAQVETITPDLARHYLTFNTHNRDIRQSRVKMYAAAMSAGLWALNGEAIKFSPDGAMQDGQHRCLAVIETDTPVQMLVVRGVAPESQATMDTGANRKLSDVLALQGEKNTVTLASAIRGVHIWESGSRVFSGGAASRLSNPLLLETFAEHQWLRDVTSEINRIQVHSHLPSRVIGALYWAFNELDATDAEYFFDRLCSDLGHDSGDPIYALRRVLLASRDVRGTRNVTYLAALTCKAWNKFRAGDRAQIIAWRPGGANPEAFPEPK